MNKKDIVQQLLKFDHNYHILGVPLISDEEYDQIKDKLRDIDPKNPYFKRVGADDNNAIDLPYYMGSLDKIKETPEVLTKWTKKFIGNYLISDKLDGVSALLHVKNNTLKMYTRGNGIKGRDISHIIKDIKGISNLPKNSDIAIRGELIIPKKEWKASYGSNARNVVAGLVNSKIVKKDILKHVHFVAYDIVNPRKNIVESFNKLKELNIETVFNTTTNTLSIKYLSDLLKIRKTDSPYEIDGIVVIDNSKTYTIKTGENPKYGFAFKSMSSLEHVEVIVKEVEWNVSKDGFIKPRVLFDPVSLDGVSISAATGFNAAFIHNNNIGKGAKITIVRSGGVIPKIEDVIKPAKHPEMPNIPYDWNDTHIDIVIKNTNNKEKDLKEIEHFMVSLEIEKIAKGTIKKLYEAGYDSIIKILNMTKDDVKKLSGFNEKSAENIVKSLATIRTKSLPNLMAASNIFGRGLGQKKIDLIYSKFSIKIQEFINNKSVILNLTSDDLKTVEGIGKVTADSFIKNIKEFKTFFESLNIHIEQPTTVKVMNNSLSNMKAVFTGFRDTSIKNYIEEHGGNISTNVTKATTIVIAKEPEKITGSVKKALELNIRVISKETFINEFMK